ncbi:ureidoglycolate lyase [Amorphus sp. 3PC139-8]|uniref:ureidoglycolate lyase n=1 Tax=Amorphus sp. 3PC139-8 TaxID=2735676 RepID=UPI00345C9C67
MIEAKALTPEAFAPFGQVLQNGVGTVKAIRDGSVTLTKTATRCVHDATADNFAIDFYEAAPEAGRLTMTQAEQHPHSAQLFVPLNANRYLVVVWESEPGDRSVPQAFLAGGRDLVVYNPGVWHHGIVALDRQTLFVSAMWKTPDGTDTVFRTLQRPFEVSWLR